MKFSGKMRLTIIFKVTKKQGFILSLEDTFLEKPQGGCALRLVQIFCLVETFVSECLNFN